MFFIEELVDGVFYIDIAAVEYLPFRCKRTFGRIGNGITDGADPMIAPFGQRIEQHIFPFDIPDLRSPESSLLTFGIVIDEIRTRLFRESRTYFFPMHQVFGFEDRQIMDIFGGIEIISAVFHPNGCRIGCRDADHRILIFGNGCC